MSDATSRPRRAGARAGGVLAQESVRGSLRIETNASANDVVRDVDRAAQRQVLATIGRELPENTDVCEEPPTGEDDGLDRRESVPSSGAACMVDAIEGTATEDRGMRFWGTSVAAGSDGEPVGVSRSLLAEGECYPAAPRPSPSA